MITARSYRGAINVYGTALEWILSDQNWIGPSLLTLDPHGVRISSEYGTEESYSVLFWVGLTQLSEYGDPFENGSLLGRECE